MATFTADWRWVESTVETIVRNVLMTDDLAAQIRPGPIIQAGLAEGFEGATS